MGLRDLDMGLLRTFVAAAENESFAVAADTVFRSQAAISQQMHRLETMLGCTLFVRIGRNKRLTDHGVRLLEYARRILRLNDEACRAMVQQVFDLPVKIGACVDGVDTLLPEYLALCAGTYPSLRVEIRVGRSRSLAAALRRGDIDLMLDVEHHDDFRQIVLRTSPVVWISGARANFQQSTSLPLALIDAPCVFRRTALESLEAQGRTWHPAFQTPTVAGLRAALRAGLGVTARTIEMLTPDLKVVDKELDLPQLPSVQFQLYSRQDEKSDATLKLCELFAST